MLAARTTTSATSFPNSPDVIGIGSRPNSANRALIFGSAMAATISLLRVSTIAVGTFLGRGSGFGRCQPISAMVECIIEIPG
jgi:hypothetical protein